MIEIDTKDLKIGMYVVHLDRPWLDTSFLFQGFLIEKDSQIEQLQHLCQKVKVDEEQSMKTVSFEPFKSSISKTAVDTGSSLVRETPAQRNKRRFEEEMEVAREVYDEASVSLGKVLNNFRLNKYITMPEVKTCVHSVVKSVMRNPNALLLLSNLRSKRQDTVTHSINVCVFSTLFGRHLNFTNEQLSQLSTAALLHDVGESKIPKEVLDKNERGLTPEEQQLMALHTQHGAEMLGKIPEMSAEAVEVAYSHHERVDGKGYPRGLKGAEISLMSKIVAIVDAYERVTNNPHPAMQISCSEALKSIYTMRGTFFDNELVESFIKCLGIYPVGSIVQLNNKAIGVVIAMKKDKHLMPTVMIVCDGKGAIRQPPQIINLDKFRNPDGKPLLMIDKVVEPNAIGANLSEYIVKELGVNVDEQIA